MNELLDVHGTFEDHETDYEENLKLTNNILNITEYLLLSTVGWQDISVNCTRYNTYSNILSVSDSTGYMLFDQSNFSREFGKTGSVVYTF